MTQALINHPTAAILQLSKIKARAAFRGELEFPSQAKPHRGRNDNKS
jgi:hypothetical protein